LRSATSRDKTWSNATSELLALDDLPGAGLEEMLAGLLTAGVFMMSFSA
jgi:hypothetical protein